MRWHSIRIVLASPALFVGSAAAHVDQSGAHPAPSSITPPVALADRGSWITEGDYPDGALKRGAQGTVLTVLGIDAQGVARTCEIRTSSGDAELDATACALLKARARFKPATDTQGRSVAVRMPERITWKLPLEHFALASSTITLAIGPAGEAGACSVAVSGDVQRENGLDCRAVSQSAFLNALLGSPASGVKQLQLRVAFSPLGMLPPPLAGQEHKVLASARIQITERGVIESCTSGKAFVIEGHTLNLCDLAKESQDQAEFELARPGSGRRVADVTMEVALKRE